MRLSDAGLRRHPSELIYPNHRPPPWLTEDATRDRSNRLLGEATENIKTVIGCGGRQEIGDRRGSPPGST
jgi:hypothetical protein